MAFSGDGLRRLRKKKHYSQDKLGADAGVNGQTISDIETGKTRRPQGETWRRIAEVPGVTIEELDAACETEEMSGVDVEPEQLAALREIATRRDMPLHMVIARAIKLLADEVAAGRMDPLDGDHEGLDGLASTQGQTPAAGPKKPRHPKQPTGRQQKGSR